MSIISMFLRVMVAVGTSSINNGHDDNGFEDFDDNGKDKFNMNEAVMNRM